MLYSVMEKHTFGMLLKEAVKDKKVSINKLSKMTGISRQYLSLIINGAEHEVSIPKRLAIAHALGISSKVALGLEDSEYEAGKILTERVEEMLRMSVKVLSGTVSRAMEIPLIGRVPAGYPLPSLQEALGKISVPVSQLGTAKDTKGLFALIVTGESLIGDQIYPGFHVVVNPDDKDITPKKIYLVCIDNAVTIKHVSLRDGRPVLESSNEEYKEQFPDQLEIIGRVVWTGVGREL